MTREISKINCLKKTYLDTYSIYDDFYSSTTNYGSEIVSKIKEQIVFTKTILEISKVKDNYYSVKIKFIYEYTKGEKTKSYERIIGIGNIVDIPSNCGAYLYDSITQLCGFVSYFTINELRKFMKELFELIECNFSKNILTFTGNSYTESCMKKILNNITTEDKFNIIRTQFVNNNSRNQQCLGNVDARSSNILKLLDEDQLLK